MMWNVQISTRSITINWAFFGGKTIFATGFILTWLLCINSKHFIRILRVKRKNVHGCDFSYWTNNQKSFLAGQSIHVMWNVEMNEQWASVLNILCTELKFRRAKNSAMDYLLTILWICSIASAGSAKGLLLRISRFIPLI